MVRADAYPGSRRSLIGIRPAKAGNVQFLDCRLARDYNAGHIPGAHYVDVRGLRSGSLSALPSPKELATHFAALGIDAESTVVPYADRFTFALAGYVWWILRYVGYKDVRVLHGGFEAWKSAHFPIETAGGRGIQQERGHEPASGPEPGRPGGQAEVPEEAVDELLVDAPWIEAHKGDKAVQLVDARTRDEFAAGHIPHADGTVNVSHDAVFDVKEGALVSPEQLKERLAPLDREKRAVAYCRSGVRSGALLWALAAAGYGSLQNYDGSILDWERRELPLKAEDQRLW